MLRFADLRPGMARLWGATLLALLSAPPALAIVNGKAVNQPRFLDEYPWAVAVQNPVTGKVCSGVLVSPSHVLTAAHCTGRNKRILLGNASRRRATSVAVAEAVRHPGFDTDTKQFDVGLLRLAEPVDLRPIDLISAGEYLLLVKAMAPATIMGWGKRSVGPEQSDQLIHAVVHLQGLSENGTQLIYRDRSAPCGGDSGGPLVVAGVDGRFVLVGVASVTDGNLCQQSGGTAAYTNIASVRDFITENVPDLP